MGRRKSVSALQPIRVRHHVYYLEDNPEGSICETRIGFSAGYHIESIEIWLESFIELFDRFQAPMESLSLALLRKALQML